MSPLNRQGGVAFPVPVSLTSPCPSLTSLSLSLIPQIISKGPGDQSWPFFQNGQKWGMYLVNHLFEGKKRPHPSSFCLATCLFFSPSYPTFSTTCHHSRQFWICRENKLVVLFRRWMGGKGLGNTVRLHKNTCLWWINPSCTETRSGSWTPLRISQTVPVNLKNDRHISRLDLGCLASYA